MQIVLYIVLGLIVACAIGFLLLTLYAGWVMLMHDIEQRKENDDDQT